MPTRLPPAVSYPPAANNAHKIAPDEGVGTRPHLRRFRSGRVPGTQRTAAVPLRSVVEVSAGGTRDSPSVIVE
ncbi:hypothetical protein GCM10010217_45830 [Streptomyces tubercidicus]